MLAKRYSESCRWLTARATARRGEPGNESGQPSTSRVGRPKACAKMSPATASEVQSERLAFDVLRLSAAPERRPIPCAYERAGDRGRTGDIQLGKLFDEGPEDYDPWEQFEDRPRVSGLPVSTGLTGVDRVSLLNRHGSRHRRATGGHFGCSSRKAKKNQQRAVHTHHVVVGEPADPPAELCLRHRGHFIDH
jgi:hypothetical protein